MDNVRKTGSEIRTGSNFITAAVIFLTFFLLSRLPLFLHFPFVYFHPDYIGYFSLVDQIDKGFWPLFTIRTPGYPLFLKFIFLFIKKNAAVIVFQNLLSLIAPLIFLKAFQKTIPNKTIHLISVTILLGLFVFSGTHIFNDCSLASDSLATNIQIAAFASLLLAIKLKKNHCFFLTAILISFAIYVRPATIYLYLIAGLTLIYLFFNKKDFSKIALLSFLIPLVVMFLLLCSYNFFTIKTFSIANLSEHMLLSYSSFFLEKDPQFPPQINKIIEEAQNFLPEEEKAIIRKSRNSNDLHWVFRKNFDLSRIRIIKRFLSLEPPDSYLLYLKWKPDFRKIIQNSILKNPAVYLKLFITNFYQYFRLIREDDDIFFSIINWNNHQVMLLNNFRPFSNPADWFYRRFCDKEYAQTVDQSFLIKLCKEYYSILKLTNDTPFELKEKSAHKVYRFIYWDIYRPIARNYLWLISLLLLGVFSMLVVWKTKFKMEESFFFFLLSISPVIHAILISSSGISSLRYTYQLEFIYYLSPLFLILLIQKYCRLKKRNSQPKKFNAKNLIDRFRACFYN